MKINPLAYQVGKPGSVRPSKALSESAGKSSEKTKNTDQISISSQGAQMAEVEQLSKAVISEIEQPTSQEKLDSIKAAVKENSYHVSTSELADVILQRWIGI